MRKTGDVFGPKHRMISNRPVLVLDLGWWSPESSYIRFHVTSLSRLARFSRVTLHVLRLPKNSLNPRNTAENSRDVDLTVLVFYTENNAEHFM